MLRADIVLSVAVGFGQRIFNDVLGARGEVGGGNIRRRSFARALHDCVTDALRRSAALRKALCRNTRVLARQSEKHVLRADISVSQIGCNLHRDLKNLLCFSCETICHIESFLSFGNRELFIRVCHRPQGCPREATEFSVPYSVRSGSAVGSVEIYSFRLSSPSMGSISMAPKGVSSVTWAAI